MLARHKENGFRQVVHFGRVFFPILAGTFDDFHVVCQHVRCPNNAASVSQPIGQGGKSHFSVAFHGMFLRRIVAIGAKAFRYLAAVGTVNKYIFRVSTWGHSALNLAVT
jgi:hypothetical protein